MRRISGLLLVLVVLSMVVACGGGGTTEPTGNGSNVPEATPTPSFPEFLPLHPEATEIQINEASRVYSYVMPGLVKDAVEYIDPQMEALGWKLIGKPNIMGHIATINMENDTSRISISLQDNERTQTTRVQFSVMKK